MRAAPVPDSDEFTPLRSSVLPMGVLCGRQERYLEVP